MKVVIKCNRISIADLKILTVKIIFCTFSVEQISLQLVEGCFFSKCNYFCAKQIYMIDLCAACTGLCFPLMSSVLWGYACVSCCFTISTLLFYKLPLAHTPPVIFLYCSALIHMGIEALECFVYLGPSSCFSGCLTRVGS